MAGLRKLDAIPVENGDTKPGTPDVEYIGGWLELKQVPRPKRETTPIRVPHYTKQQRVWHRRRWFKGGAVFVLIRIGKDWMLIDGDVASKVLGKLPFNELAEQARKVWYKKLDHEELLCLLRRGR